MRSSTRRAVSIAGLAVVAVALAWELFVAVPHRYSSARARAAAPSASVTPAGRRIKAELFYVSDDGQQLTAVERDVPFAEGTDQQAREIVAAQIAPVPEPLVSPIPSGTLLRSIFVTERGNAYVDLSREVSANHPGGSVNELLTVYAIVDALTANLPAITSVQLLIDGKAAVTLAGHVDLRRPLTKSMTWVQ